jgi:conjugal transfer pilus assembly protein TraW
MFNRIIFLLLSIYSHNVFSDQLGKTYPIIEKDFRQELNQRIENTDLSNYDINRSSAIKPFYLPDNSEVSQAQFVPYYTLDFDIHDGKGDIIYPKGFTFNIAEYVTMPFRLLVFSEEQLPFLDEHYQTNDVLLLTSGNIISVREKTQKTVFLMEPKIAERFRITGVPTIVEQVDAQYQVTAYVYEP